MKYLKEFTNKSDYDAAYASGALPFPHVCKVGEEVIYASEFESEVDVNLPFYIEALEDLTVSFSTNTIQYSLDRITWNDLAPNTPTPTVTSGSKIYFKAYKLSADSSIGTGTFNISGRCNLGGNIASLYLGLDFDKYHKCLISCPNYYFFKLFYNQQTIINADRLIISFYALGEKSLEQMFEKCSSLINAPSLLFMMVNYRSLYRMFANCTSLVNASKIKLEAIGSSGTAAFSYMFSNCTSLVNAPFRIRIPSGYIGSMCNSMFYYCTSLVDAPEIISNTALSTSSDYSKTFNYMFYGCTSLVNVPDLNFEVDITNMSYMFYGCVSLVNAPTLTLAGSGTNSSMYIFSGCSKLRNVLLAIKLYNNSSINWGYIMDGCPSLQNVTIINISPYSTNLGCISNSTINVTLHKDPSLTIVDSYVVTNWNIVNNVYEEV